MSTTTKAKAAEPQVETEAAKPQPRSRVTRPEDFDQYATMIDRKFRLKDGSAPHIVYTPKHIFEEYLAVGDEMESSAICARFSVEYSNGEAEPQAPLMVLGREIRTRLPARSPVKQRFWDCALFAEECEEIR